MPIRSLHINEKPAQFNSTLSVLSSVNLLGDVTASAAFEAPYGNVLHSTYADATLSALNSDFAGRAVFAVAASGCNTNFYVKGFYYGDGSKLSNVNGALGYDQGGGGTNIVPSKGSNTISSGTYSGILGGQNNTMANNNSFIIGSNITSSQANTTFVESLYALSAIYGGGNEVIMSDGSNDNGNGANTLTVNFSSGNYFTNTTYFSGISASGKTFVSNLTAQNFEVSGNTGVSSFFVLRDSTGKRWKFGTDTSGNLTSLGAA